MTLKEYFDAADQRREKERQKKSQLLAFLCISTNCFISIYGFSERSDEDLMVRGGP